MQQSIPVVDLRQFADPAGRDAFVQKYGDALRELGFVAIEGYGIDDALFEQAYDVFRRFFALSEDVKKKYEVPETGRARGYTSFGVEHAKDNAKPDLKEFFHVGRALPAEDPFASRLVPNVWPEEIPELRKVCDALFAQLDEVSYQCLEALSIYLGAEPSFLRDMAVRGNTVHRFIHYPVCDGFDEPGVMRAAQHEDINLMTLLPPADESGLELLTRDGTWLPIHAIPGQIIADTGDMMSRLTNDVIPATTHRVVNPKGEPKPRYSMPFFVHPHFDVTLEVMEQCLAPGEAPKYAPINNHDFLLQRLHEIGLKKA
ncbi:MAG: isopenicillin N synthase family oxygenase [Myxococcales bacterium]|nr:isopenicillin N synthase family oxygenase [Myxococcales bacterium]